MAVSRVFSAGGIVFKKENDGIKVLVSQHSGHHGWDFPKGHIEKGETAKEAAVREVEEETGVKARILEKVGETKYFYFEKGQRVFKTVTFFIMEYAGEGEATTAFETQDMVWLDPDEVGGRLSFDDTKRLWKEARGKILNLKLSRRGRIVD